jgi:hypothetical protein
MKKGKRGKKEKINHKKGENKSKIKRRAFRNYLD